MSIKLPAIDYHVEKNPISKFVADFSSKRFIVSASPDEIPDKIETEKVEINLPKLCLATRKGRKS